MFTTLLDPFERAQADLRPVDILFCRKQLWFGLMGLRGFYQEMQQIIEFARTLFRAARQSLVSTRRF
jgi:hypothetical protein